MNSTAATPTTSVRQVSILCVDDEPSVLGALRRLFQARGYRVLIAQGGVAGLETLQAEYVDLVISDMRMPEMDGAQFLEQVRSRWPETVRLLLTGYSDIRSTVDAINHGEVYRYVTKPWDDEDIALIVRQALERQALEREKRRLEELTVRQNTALTALNGILESKVKARTAALEAVNAALSESNEKLKASNGTLAHVNAKLEKNFVTSIKVFTNLIDMRGGQIAGRSRRIANLAWEIALKLGLDEKYAYDVLVAGLLHEIGKIGFPDELLLKPFYRMSDEEIAQYFQHPVIGHSALIPLQDLRDAAIMIRGQHERYEGGGSPDGLSGDQIPPGARILAVAGDYYRMQAGTLFPYQMSAKDARSHIRKGSGKTYDPRVVEAFADVVSGTPSDSLHDVSIAISDLRPGMKLSRDLVGSNGMLILAAEHVLDRSTIEQIQNIDIDEAALGRIAIHAQ